MFGDIEAGRKHSHGATRVLPPPALSEPIANIGLLCLPNMAAEEFGIATGAIGLAATVFQTAKGIRDIIHTVSSSTLILPTS